VLVVEDSANVPMHGLLNPLEEVVECLQLS
jgi:hypothetical protein